MKLSVQPATLARRSVASTALLFASWSAPTFGTPPITSDVYGDHDEEQDVVPVTFVAAVATADGHPLVRATATAADTLTEAAKHSPGLDANPIFGIGVGPRLAPANQRDVEGYITLAQPINLKRSAARRKESLVAESHWLFAEARHELLLRRLAVAYAWLKLWESWAQLDLARRVLAEEHRFLELTTRLQQAGERTRAEVATVDARVAQAHLLEKLAEGTLQEARMSLGQEVGFDGGSHFVPSGDAPDVPAPNDDELERLKTLSTQLPAVRARELFAISEQSRLAEERASRGPTLQVGIEALRDTPGGVSLYGTLQVTLPFVDLAAREAAARQATYLRASGDAQVERRNSESSVLMALHELEHSEAVWKICAQTLVPAAQLARELRDKEFTLRSATLLEVLDARRTYFDALAKLKEAELNRTWARVRVAAMLAALSTKDGA